MPYECKIPLFDILCQDIALIFNVIYMCYTNF